MKLTKHQINEGIQRLQSLSDDEIAEQTNQLLTEFNAQKTTSDDEWFVHKGVNALIPRMLEKRSICTADSTTYYLGAEQYVRAKEPCHAEFVYTGVCHAQSYLELA